MLDGRFDAIVTSPPYPGLIDYHEQHRYAYELLGLDDRRDRELGAAALGTSRRALADYVDGISRVLVAQSRSLERGAPVIVVVNDRRDLYPEILERSGLRLVDRLERHVNRRTGRRAGEYLRVGAGLCTGNVRDRRRLRESADLRGSLAVQASRKG